ncbi:MAG: metallophosphoesterase, partial [Acutalibacteraceae bacterium]|nr:metallophosphoesterase [Acutalibacteraceae bacterium]
DIHIGGGLFSLKKDAKAMNAVAAMITAEKPDLVVLTGDMVYPVPFQAGTFNNEISTKLLITLMEKLGVYYTVCFGNHDSEAYGTHKTSDFRSLG